MEIKLKKMARTEKREKYLPRLAKKRSINLASYGEKRFNWKGALPAVAILLVFGVLFGKLAIMDRLVAVSMAQMEVANLQIEVTNGYTRINGYGELVDQYAHYTYSGMTTEELQQTERARSIALLKKYILPKAKVDNWSVSGNVIQLPISGMTLQEINLIVQEVEQDEEVLYCTVTTASTRDSDGTKPAGTLSDLNVTAQVSIYLNEREGSGSY